MDATKILQGDPWLGHPVHPLTVAGPIGMWVLSLVLDSMSTFSKNECAKEAASVAITSGLVAAGFSAATGLAEYTRVPRDKRAQNEAFIHGSLNATATAMFGVNAALRANARKAKKDAGWIPKILTLAGVGIIAYTGWLGGNLAYRHGTGVQLDQALSERSGEIVPTEEPKAEGRQAPAEGRRRTRSRERVTS